MAYHVLIDGAQHGPYETATIDRMIHDGRIDGGTYVWKAGMAEWTFADNVPEIAALLRAAATLPAESGRGPARAGRLSVVRAFGDAGRALVEDPVRTFVFGVILYLLLLAIGPLALAWALSVSGFLPSDGAYTGFVPLDDRVRAYGIVSGGAFVAFALHWVVLGGLCASALAMVRRQPVTIARMFAGFRRSFAMIAFGVLASAMVAAGAVALLLPGIFLAVALALGPMVIMDRRAGPLDGIGGSVRVVLRLGWFRCFAVALLLAVAFLLLAAIVGFAVGLDAGVPAGGGEAGLGIDAMQAVKAQLSAFVANPTLEALLLFNAVNTLALMFTAGVLASMYGQGRDALEHVRT